MPIRGVGPSSNWALIAAPSYIPALICIFTTLTHASVSCLLLSLSEFQVAWKEWMASVKGGCRSLSLAFVDTSRWVHISCRWTVQPAFPDAFAPTSMRDFNGFALLSLLLSFWDVVYGAQQLVSATRGSTLYTDRDPAIC